ncbi:MAG: hypothetical protein ACREMK_08835 [Gemmatimonadota bacterium]
MASLSAFHRWPAQGACVLLLALGLVGGRVEIGVAQGPGIPELRRLIDERETDITRLEAQLRSYEERASSLSQAKRDARPGSARFEALSNQILDASREITGLARRLRVLYEQVHDLQTDLYLAYNREIAEAGQRIEELTSRPRTDETAAEISRLVDRLQEYIPARDEIALALESGEENLLLLDITFDPRDDPSELRVKLAIARDLIERIDQRISAIENKIVRAEQRKRTMEEFRRLKGDLDLWDDRGGSGRQLDAILEDRSAGASELGAALEDPDASIRQLQRTRIELNERRTGYQNLERLFAQRLEEFYP